MRSEVSTASGSDRVWFVRSLIVRYVSTRSPPKLGRASGKSVFQETIGRHRRGPSEISALTLGNRSLKLGADSLALKIRALGLRVRSLDFRVRSLSLKVRRVKVEPER